MKEEINERFIAALEWIKKEALEGYKTEDWSRFEGIEWVCSYVLTEYKHKLETQTTN